jgi:SAM-dependent methyltransferase
VIPETAPSQYDDFAWFYHKYWGSGPTSFASRVLPVVERFVLARVPPGGQILDVCCGTGQLAGILSTKGYTVTGIDGSAEMLRFARTGTPGLEVIHADARAFALPPRFDGAVCLYDSLNHLLQLGELGAAFRNVHAALKEGGAFLCDFNMQAGFEARWRGSFGIAEDDHVLVYRASYDAGTKVGRSAITMFRRQVETWRRTDVMMYQRCYAEGEITDALRAAGFAELAVFDAEHDLHMEGQRGRSFFSGRAR